jgi:hypothetical protein
VRLAHLHDNAPKSPQRYDFAGKNHCHGDCLKPPKNAWRRLFGGIVTQACP